MKNVFKHSGTLRAIMPLTMLRALGLMLFVTLLASLLVGCQTSGMGTTVTDNEGQCIAWRAITYSTKKDTAMTVQQVREHNATGKRLRCWK